jgi:hypothetical protein
MFSRASQQISIKLIQIVLAKGNAHLYSMFVQIEDQVQYKGELSTTL